MHNGIEFTDNIGDVNQPLSVSEREYEHVEEKYNSMMDSKSKGKSDI